MRTEETPAYRTMKSDLDRLMKETKEVRDRYDVWKEQVQRKLLGGTEVKDSKLDQRVAFSHQLKKSQNAFQTFRATHANHPAYVWSNASLLFIDIAKLSAAMARTNAEIEQGAKSFIRQKRWEKALDTVAVVFAVIVTGICGVFSAAHK